MSAQSKAKDAVDDIVMSVPLVKDGQDGPLLAGDADEALSSLLDLMWDAGYQYDDLPALRPQGQ